MKRHTELFCFLFPYHFQFCFLVVVVIAVVNDVNVDIVVGVAVVVVFLWPWWPDQSFIVLFSPGFSRPSPNTHTSNSIYCVMQPVANLPKVLFHLVCSSPSTCTFVWAMPSRHEGRSDSLLWSDHRDWAMSFAYSMVADALHLVSSCFCLFIAIKSAISRPVLLQHWGRNGLLLLDLTRVTSQHVQAQFWGFIRSQHQMSADCCISSSVNQNFWGCFMKLPERNRWRKSCALINLVSWLKLVKLRLNYLRLDPLNILQCSICSKFIATSDLICFMCPTDSIKSGDVKTAIILTAGSSIPWKHTQKQNHQTFCEPGTVSWDQPTFEDWEPQRSSPAPIVPQTTPAHFIWSCVMSELCQVAPGPIAIFTHAAHQRPRA